MGTQHQATTPQHESQTQGTLPRHQSFMSCLTSTERIDVENELTICFLCLVDPNGFSSLCDQSRCSTCSLGNITPSLTSVVKIRSFAEGFPRECSITLQSNSEGQQLRGTTRLLTKTMHANLISAHSVIASRCLFFINFAIVKRSFDQCFNHRQATELCHRRSALTTDCYIRGPQAVKTH